MLEASLISSVFGLNVTPRNVIVFFKSLLFKIFSTLFIDKNLRLSFDVTTVLTIDKSVLNFLPVSIKALVSFGKHDPP